jgi:PKD repeat protein
VVNGSFTVPEDAAGIETRMRVIVEYESDPEACGGGQFGEVEDYTVQISTRPSQPPVADFSANATSLGEGEAVEFTDLSSGAPTSWDWSFSGGTPATSSDENPTVRYATAGTYAVTLTVANSDGSDSESKSAYITVVETPMVNYCNASGNSQQYEYIGGVEVGDMNQPSGPSAYSDFTNIVATLPAGESANVALTPQFSSDAYSEAWRIWIDYNGDGDFLDSGELVFSDTSTSDVTGSFVVPSSATGSTRMRVALQWQTPSNSCGSFDYGEVEDYSVQFASGT